MKSYLKHWLGVQTPSFSVLTSVAIDVLTGPGIS